MIQVRIVMKQSWNDLRLHWKPESFNGIDYIHVNPEELWNPEVILYNNIDGQFKTSLEDAPALVTSNGQVWNAA